MPKITFQESDVITLTFFDDCTAKYRYIALKFVLVVCMQLYNIYSGFWITPKFWILVFIFEKKKF